MIKQARKAHVVREPEIRLDAKTPVVLELVARRKAYPIEIAVARREVAATKSATVVHTHHWQGHSSGARYLGRNFSRHQNDYKKRQ